ncbi:MAG: ribonuclease H-like domain-containing protein [Lachnospiraceae bacterium]|nr:ribonuclease H-like domain-containing protein [Lachnospiraceae bacterium]
MKEFTFRYEGMHPGYPIGELAPEDRILFIDIETTGLSREHSDLYLIGCGFFDSDGYNTIQWFAQSPGEESLIIRRFTAFINGRFSLLVHYNGNHFDIPYLSYKAGKHGLENPLSGLDNYDIYAAVKPLKNILGLYSLRQRCIEQLLDINSDDPYTGRELIRVYHDYVKTQDEKLLHPLIYHNSEDLKGMGLILPILHYTSLKDTPLSYVSHEIHGFSDLSGNSHSEILADYTHSLNIPKSIMIKHDDIVISLRSDKTAVIRIPLISETLKHYYDDYKNYYYLPAEDCCILKEIASGVDSSRIENAKKETCYTKHSGLFIPAITAHNTLFRSDLSSKRSYIPYSENDASKILSSIGSEILRQTF